MTRTIDTVENVPAEKKRAVWKPLAAAGIGGAVLVATGFGVFAQLQAQATNTTPQAVNTGDLKLELKPQTVGGAVSAGFTQGVNNIAPGDSVSRFVSLQNTGSLDALTSSLKLKVTDTVGSLLTTDATRGLQLRVQSCSQAWTGALTSPNATPFVGNPTAAAAAPKCDGTESPALSTNLAAFTGTGAPQPLTVLGTAAGDINFLQVTLSLPDQNEVSVNGGTPSPVASGAPGFTGIGGAATSIQRLAASLTFTFTEDQRTKINSNS